MKFYTNFFIITQCYKYFQQLCIKFNPFSNSAKVRHQFSYLQDAIFGAEANNINDLDFTVIIQNTNSSNTTKTEHDEQQLRR